MKIKKIPKGISELEFVNTLKYYPVRSGNKLFELKKWINWAKKQGYANVNTIFITDNIENMRDELSQMRMKAGHSKRYTAYIKF